MPTRPFKFLYPTTETFSLGMIPTQISRNTGLRMRDIIKKSAVNEYVRKWAEHITQDIIDRDEHGEIEAIFKFLQSKTRYVHDPRGHEYTQTPPYILKQIEVGTKPGLDCDDYTTLGLSLARSIGYATKIRIVSFRKNGAYSHVFGLVQIRGKWTPFDAVRKDETLGWQAPGITRVLDIPV